MKGPGGVNYLNILPDFTSNWDLAVAVFIMPIAVQWWAVWYPGAEPGGGSYIAQRMLASKSEKDSLGRGALLQRRPLRAAALAVDPRRRSARSSSTRSSRTSRRPSRTSTRACSATTSPIPAMLKFLPVGFVGLMVGGLIAANSSTILTHLNWGASYLVHDFYQRFIRKNATEKHYVLVGRLATVRPVRLLLRHGLPARHAPRTPSTSSSRSGPGTGLLYLVRWFWWRVNAWCEVVAMVSSFLVSLALLVLAKNGVHFSTHVALLVTIAVTTVVLGRDGLPGAADRPRRCSSSSTRRSGPFGPGWRRIREEAGARRGRGAHAPGTTSRWRCSAGSPAARRSGRRSSRSATSSTAGRATRSCASAVFAVAGIVLIRVVNRLWQAGGEAASARPDRFRPGPAPTPDRKLG